MFWIAFKMLVGNRGKYVGMVPGDVRALHVRVDIDEFDIPRFRPDAPAWAVLEGHARQESPLTFVRVEPYVIPKRSLTGESTERVDTRVSQVIYAIDTNGRTLYVGQQMDVFIDEAASATSAPKAGTSSLRERNHEQGQSQPQADLCHLRKDVCA